MRPDPDDKPVLPAQSEDETGIGWGEAPEAPDAPEAPEAFEAFEGPEPDDYERLRRERPPHWDQ
jgi:hypothetical protein